MKKTLIAAAVAGALIAPGVVLAQAAVEPASPHTLTANVGVVSDYLFRGISQTKGAPAIQGGFDYSHASGLYAGTWLSSVSWYSDTVPGASKSLEFDVYGGYKGSINDEFGYDVGVFQYTYPGSRPDGAVSPDTTELYGALSWKWLTVKYSHVVSKNFVAWANPATNAESKGSNYLELNAAYDLGEGWGLVGHIGHQRVKNFNSASDSGGLDASYTDWNLGVTKDVGFGVVALKYSDTDAKTSCSSGSGAYCWDGYEAGQGRTFVSFTKTF